MKANLVPHFFEQMRIKFGYNAHHALCYKHNISSLIKTIYFWIYWLLTGDECPLLHKLELFCSIDKYNFPPNLSLDVGISIDDSISTM